MKWFQLAVLAFRQHFLERLKSPLLLALPVVVWLAAALPNSLGTSSLFWMQGYLAYGQTCLALGLLCAAWAWVSLLADTGQDWLRRPAPIRIIERFFKVSWPSLTSFEPAHVFYYLGVSTFLLSVVFGLSHACHVMLVPLPAAETSALWALCVTSFGVFAGSLVGILFLFFSSRLADARFARSATNLVAANIRHLADDRQVSGYDYTPSDEFFWLHETAFIAGMLGTGILTTLVLPGWFGFFWGGLALHLCLLAMLLSFAVGFAIYRQRTGTAWFGLLAAAALYIAFSLSMARHPIANLSSLDDRMTLAAALDRGKQQADNRVSDSSPVGLSKADNKRPLVVVAVSGGGIRAQVWALATLCALDHSLPGFNANCHLVTGASGGMVGAAHYVASLQDARDLRAAQLYGKLLRDASRDALTKTFNAHIVNDILGAIPRRLGRQIGFDIVDRGRVLESEWIRHTGGEEKSVFAQPLSSLADTEKDLKLSKFGGWRPVLVFAPTIAEDGRRLIICNQRVDNLVANYAPTITGDEQPTKLLSVDSIHLADIDPEAHQSLTLATAARLNANFPLVVSSPELAVDANGTPLHVIDGGYYDNYGVNLAARWIDEHAATIKNNYSGVLLLQIVASHRYRKETGASGSIFPEASYFNVGFQKTTYLTDLQVNRLATLFGDLRAGGSESPYFSFCSLEFDGPVSLNWMLTSSELYALLFPYLELESTPFSGFPERLKGLDDFKRDFVTGKAIFESRFPHVAGLKTTAEPTPGTRALAATKKRISSQVAKLQDWWRAASSSEK